MSLIERVNPAGIMYGYYQHEVKRLNFDVPPTLHPVSSIHKIAQSSLFSDYAGKDTCHVFTDYDGVIQNVWNHDSNNYGSVRKIVSHSSSVTIVTARIPDVFASVESAEKGYPFPVFPDELQEKITSALTQMNPSCEIRFLVGLGKLRPGVLEEGLYRPIREHIRKGQTVVDIGSSFFDAAHFYDLCNFLRDYGIQDVSKLHYFTTGHLLM